MPDENLSFKLPAELKARVHAEAEALRKGLSAHARDILNEHFEGRSVEQVREHLGELTAAVEALGARSGGVADSAALEQISVEIARLRQQVGLLATTIHHALRIIVYQELRPSEEQFQELEAVFEALRKHYQGGG